MAYIPTDTEQATIREILGRNETAVVVDAANGGIEILSVADYPTVCREYYIGRFVQSVFRSEYDLEARLMLARAKVQT